MAIDPLTIIIFGASGDLTKRKLIPSLFNLYQNGKLPDHLNILGLSRTNWNSKEFRNALTETTKNILPTGFSRKKWGEFCQLLHYSTFDVEDKTAYKELSAKLSAIENVPSNRLLYLATAPRFFSIVIENLGQAEITREQNNWRRIVVEKPFGRDFRSAKDLNKLLHQSLSENQIYRIDHYLAKETVQNILVFRFANTIFEPLWNSNYIDHVQITAAETVDVEHRAGYYDKSGVLRDMFQNHLLQLLALVSMETPISFNADALRDEKVKVLSVVKPFDLNNVQETAVMAQYDSYAKTEGVAAESRTPTFAAVKFYIDNWRWQGVPFYLRSGKALKQKTTEIIIQFKAPPHQLFPDIEKENPDGVRANYLSLCIQPDEGIHLRFEAKLPGTKADTQPVDMDFHYREEFNETVLPDAYERLLLDAMQGDASLFTRADGIEQAWKIMDPLISYWEHTSSLNPVIYEKGSWGPDDADTLLINDERKWRIACGGHC